LTTAVNKEQKQLCCNLLYCSVMRCMVCTVAADGRVNVVPNADGILAKQQGNAMTCSACYEL
jgi:hypothetical protein